MSSKKPDTRTRILEATWNLMEQRRGQGIRMGDIAKETGISRQALYLHFKSRTELVIATVHYVDEIKGLEERMARIRTAKNGTQLLESCIEEWGSYMPEIYGIAKALVSTRETDPAAAVAWDGCMGCVKDLCHMAMAALQKEGNLAEGWSQEEAAEALFILISFQSWEQLTVDMGWSTPQYVTQIKKLARSAFVA